jgi:hypothetical protein
MLRKTPLFLIVGTQGSGYNPATPVKSFFLTEIYMKPSQARKIKRSLQAETSYRK